MKTRIAALALLVACVAAGLVVSWSVQHWWPLAAGFIIAWAFKLMGLEPGSRDKSGS